MLLVLSGRFGRLAVLLSLAAVLPLVVGCGGTPPKKTSSNTSSSKPKPKPPEPKKPVDPNAFPSVDAAIAAIEKGHEEKDQKLGDLARDWLVSKGAAIEPQMTAQLKNKDAHLAIRLQACYIIAQMGSTGAAPLLAMTTPETEPGQLRQQAINCMAMIKPTNKQVIDRLVELSSDKDPKARTAALTGIKRIGPPVKDAHPEIVQKLMDMLNSQTEDDAFRNLAKLALKSVEPRHGFSGMGKVDKK